MKAQKTWIQEWLIENFGPVLTMVILLCPSVSAAQGQLETPQPGSFQSGISVVRGWVCQANRVDIEVVGRGTLPAVYGEARGDTQLQCGDVNNGFSLQVNWNELGEGSHTVRALVDGVEVGRALVIVATLGAPYLQGAQGDFVVGPFPQSGNQTRLHWQESQQSFALASGSPASTGGGSPRTDAKLEDPQPGSFQSGIGLVRGWACAAERIDIEVDGRFMLPAVYGEPRGDTQTVCGDDNNGFSFLVNWNEIGDGAHTVRALADGVELGSATFTVVTLGLGSFPRGLVGDFVLNNFPQPPLQTEVRWQESQQNFVIAGARFPGQNSALCTTRNGQVSDSSGATATISVTNPCLLSGNVAFVQMQVPSSTARLREESKGRGQAATEGAFPLCATNLRIEQGVLGFGPGDFRLLDFTGTEVCRNVPRGETSGAVLQVDGQSQLNFNGPFTLMYDGRPVAAFSTDTPAGAPQLAVSAQDLTFADTTIGEARESSFTVTNVGGGTLAGGMTLIAADAGANIFSLASAQMINLGAGEQQTVTVRFHPVSTGEVMGSLRITTNGGVSRVLLHGGTPTTPPRLTVSTMTLDFGKVVIPATVDRTLTITNSGTGVLTGRVFLPTSGRFSAVEGVTFSIGANQSQSVTIRFAPTVAGTVTAKAFVSSNAGEVAVQLVAEVTGPTLSVTGLDTIFGEGPRALQGLDFGNCKSGTESFTVRNVGEGTLIGTVTTSAPFRVTKGASFSLEAGRQQKVSIKLTKKPKSGQFLLGGADVESNGGSRGVPLFAGCFKIKLR